MLPRAVLAYVILLPFLVMGAADTQYNIAVSMSSDVPGHLQIYYFRPDGTNGGVQTPLRPGPTSRVYRLQVPAGDYLYLRVDPGTAPGQYVIRRVAIVSSGPLETVIPLTHFRPNPQLAVRESTRQRLALAANDVDPQLLYAPPAPLRFKSISTASLFFRFAAWWCLVVAGIWILERAGVRLQRWWERAAASIGRSIERNSRAGIAVVACLGTVLSAYPVLFMGRSFIAPNNGGNPQLYEGLPFVPGSTDVEIEDVRGSDTAATFYEFIPYAHIQREALQDGELPLWNRYNAAGRPLWGQGMSSLLEPLHLFTLLTPDPAWGWDLKFIAHRFTFALGIGLVALAATGAWLPSALVAAGAPFIGFYAYRLSHPAVFSITYAPWVLLAVLLLARAVDLRRRMRAAVFLSASTSLVIVASIPKETTIIVLGLAVVAALTLLRSPGAAADRRGRFAAGLLAAAAAVLLTAPHWLVFLDTLRQSIVPPYEKPSAVFAGTRHAVALVMSPLMPGDVLPGLHPLFAMLGLAAICAPGRLLSRPVALACALTAAGLLAIAFGAIPGRWIVNVPFIANIGHIYDVFVTAAIVPLIVVAAFGAQVLLDAGPLRRTAVAVLTSLAGWWIIATVASLSPPHAIEVWLSVLVLALAALLPWCFFRWHGKNPVGLSMLASLAAVVVLILPGGLHPSTDAPLIDRLLVQPRVRLPAQVSAPALDAVHRIASEPARTAGIEWTLVPGMQALYGLEAIGGADALQVPIYEELVGAGGIHRLGSWFTTVAPSTTGQVAPLLDLLNVRSLMGRPDLVPVGVVGTPEVPLDGPDRLRVVRRDSSWPRAFFVDGLIEYATPADLIAEVSARQKPFAAIQAGDERALTAVGAVTRGGGPAIPAQSYSLTVNTTTFVVRATGAGVAVLGETFLPDDFRATLNGQRVPYFRVNHAFKAVLIPSAGDWSISFEYVPRQWTLAWMLAGIGAVLLAGLALTPSIAQLLASRRTAPQLAPSV